MTKPTLAVYVAPGCWGCGRARQIATAIERSCLRVRVTVVSLGDGVVAPPQVVGVPAYVLDGKVISLGNPDVRILVEMLNRQG